MGPSTVSSGELRFGRLELLHTLRAPSRTVKGRAAEGCAAASRLGVNAPAVADVRGVNGGTVVARDLQEAKPPVSRGPSFE
jgi:hypothetical protein